MNINDFLNKHGHGLFFNSMIATTADLKYPYPITTREDVLYQLEEMEMATHDRLEGYIRQPTRPVYNPENLSRDQVYMLRQRYLCGFDALSRLVDALPSPDYFSLKSSPMETELVFLLSNLWKEFGQYWMASLAWRLVQELEQ